MLSLFILFIGFSVHICLSEGVKCYKCNNVRLSDIDSCTQTETCPSSKQCAYIYSSGSVRMGCIERDICELLIASDLVGKRELKSTSSCCNTDYCNGPPQTTTQKTTTLAPTMPSQLCADKSPLFCGNAQLYNTICSDEKLATQFCMNTCGRCPTTTMKPCLDNSPELCSSPGAKLVLCLDKTTALQYCQKTCGFCPGSHHSVATVTKYTTSVPTVTMTSSATTTTNTTNFNSTSSKLTATITTASTTPSKSTTTTTKPVPSTTKPTTTISITTPSTTTTKPITSTTKPTTTITNTTPTTTTKPVISTTKRTTTISITTPTTTTTTLMTTTPVCEDTEGLHCYDPEVSSIVCSDIQLQSMCSKTCKIC